jgi:hypothetical protein
MIKRLAALLLLLAASAAGCGHPLIPESALAPSRAMAAVPPSDRAAI